MGHCRISMVDNDETFETLSGFLPESGRLDILITAKVPEQTSVVAGHYFQGRQRQQLWSRLKQAGLLSVRSGEYENEALLRHRIGLMDIVKKPMNYGNEPSPEEYRQGVDRVIRAVFTHQPKVLIFVYKRVLDQLLQQGFREPIKTHYGFNEHIDHLFPSKVFVFPMPSMPCSKETAERAMSELVRES